MPKTIAINGVKIMRGEKRQVNLNVSRLPTRTVIEIPVLVHRAKKDGPVLLLLAGMHGDELNGVEMLRKIIVEGSVEPEKGTVIIIPLFNIYGFLNFSRQVPDGKDVNRSFPGSQGGSLASQMAYTFMKKILPCIDYGIDFHTGGGSIYNYPQIRCTFDRPENLELAKAFSPPFIINAPLRDKTLRKEAQKRGKTIIVFEGGESVRLNVRPVHEGIKGTLRVMQHLGMISHSVPAVETILINRTIWVRTEHAGIFRTIALNGSPVKKGEILGSISDPYGDFEMNILSPVNGYVIGINYKPVINQGDALIHLGIQQKKSDFI